MERESVDLRDCGPRTGLTPIPQRIAAGGAQIITGKHDAAFEQIYSRDGGGTKIRRVTRASRPCCNKEAHDRKTIHEDVSLNSLSAEQLLSYTTLPIFTM